jgi:hypothetical protein
VCEPAAPGVGRRALLAGGAAVAGAAVLGVGGRAHALSLRAAPVAVADGLAIWPRDAWAPGPPVGPLAGEDVRFLLVHHTAASTQHRASDVPGLLGAMYRFHTGEKGWPDIAYNFLVDREGGVWEGRGGSLAGPVAADASGGSQGFAQLVCFIGDFTGEQPTAAALSAGTRTLAWLAQRYGVPTAVGATVSFTSRGSNRWPTGATVTTATIAGHRDMSTTACPGNAFYPYVHNGLQRDVHVVRGGSLSAPATAAPATTAPATTTPASTTPPSTTPASTTPPSTAAAASTAPPSTAVSSTSTTPSTTPTSSSQATGSTAAASTAAATTGAGATSAGGELAAAAPTGDSGGVGGAVVPIAVASAGAAAALVWLRQRAQRPDAEVDAED